jgi:hypothetical protein
MNSSTFIKLPTLPLYVLSLVCLCSSIIGAADTDSEKWFTPENVAKNVWMISDAKNNNAYLVIGEEKALLIDTGRGAGDLIPKSCLNTEQKACTLAMK